MKKLLNKKLIFPALLLVLVIFIVILYKLGFRITYAPKLENSWNAVSAVATCVGVLASFIAIWFAIQVPNKIAEQQNKIALLEKRLEFYNAIKRCIFLGECCKIFEQLGGYRIFLISFISALNYGPVSADDDDQKIFLHLWMLIQDIKQAIEMGRFLFDFDLNTDMEKMLYNLEQMSLTYSDDSFKIFQESYIEYVNKIKEKDLPLIEKAIMLSQEKSR